MSSKGPYINPIAHSICQYRPRVKKGVKKGGPKWTPKRVILSNPAHPVVKKGVQNDPLFGPLLGPWQAKTSQKWPIPGKGGSKKGSFWGHFDPFWTPSGTLISRYLPAPFLNHPKMTPWGAPWGPPGALQGYIQIPSRSFPKSPQNDPWSAPWGAPGPKMTPFWTPFLTPLPVIPI